MKYNLNKEQLKLTCINLSDEIKKADRKHSWSKYNGSI